MPDTSIKSIGSSESLRAIALVAILVVAVPAAFMGTGAFLGESAGIASAQENDTVRTDDFEDESTDGWISGGPNTITTITDGVTGSSSLQITDGDHTHAYWMDGPTFDTHDNFEIRGTYRASSSSGGATYRFGLAEATEESTNGSYTGDDPNGDVAYLVVDNSRESIYLSTAWREDDPESGIDQAYHDTWMNFRLSFEGGTMRAQVWEVGTEQPTDWQMEKEYEQFEGKFYANAGTVDNGRELLFDSVDAGGRTISGQVVDQHGDPVPNATVEAYGVDYDRLNATADDLNETAEELLQRAEDPLPNSWDENFDQGSYISSMTDSDQKYVLAHNPEHIDVPGGPIDYATESVTAGGSIDGATVVLDPDGPQIFSVWKPGTGGDNALDESFPGGIKSESNVTIEQLSPTGEVIDTRTIESRWTYTIDDSWFGETNRDLVHANLPPGHFYRVYPASNEAAAITVVVGDPEDIASTIQSNLETEANQLTERSQFIQDNIASGTFGRSSTTANETGHYSLFVRSGISRAAVQAYHADSEVFTGSAGVSLEDVRRAQESGVFNGSVYLSPLPVHTQVPEEDVQVELHKVEAAPFGNLSNYEERLDQLLAEYLNTSVDELEDRFLGDLNATQLDNLWEEYKKLAETNDELSEKLENISNSDSSAEKIEELQQTINELEESVTAEEINGNIENGELFWETTFSESIEEAVVTIQYQDGTTEVVPDEHVSVSSGGAFGSDQVVVEDYPIPDDAAVADVQVDVSSGDGLGSVRGQLTNPEYAGSVPQLDAIDLDTVRPGSSEMVGMELRPAEDGNYGELQGVTVFGPDGDEVDVTVENQRARFQTRGEGIYTIQPRFTSSSGETFQETIQVRAHDEPTSPPATIRASEGPTGTYAIVGENLDSARVESNDITGEVSVTGIVPGDETPPSEVHVMVDPIITASTTSLDFEMVVGPDEEFIDRRVGVVYHTESLPEDSIVWRRGGEPITRDGETSYGILQEREDGKYVIRTYSDTDGQVRLEVLNDPGIIDRSWHRLLVWLPAGVGSMIGGTLAVVVVGRRRGWSMW